MKKAPRGDYSVYAEKGDGTYVKVFEGDYTRSDAPEVTVTKLVTDKSPEVRPDYYKCGNLECFDILRWMVDDDFDICNAVKYAFRAGRKTTVKEDLVKLRTCLLDGMDNKLGVSKRELYNSGLPDWKIMLIDGLMNLIMEDDDEIKKLSYANLVSHVDFLIEHAEELKS